MGARFDFGEFFESSGKFIYDILSEEQKHKKKLKQIQEEMENEERKAKLLHQLGLEEGKQGAYLDIFKDKEHPIKTRVWAGQRLGIVPQEVPQGEWGTPEYWQGMRPLNEEEIEAVGRGLFGEPGVVGKTFTERVAKHFEETGTAYPGLTMEETKQKIGARVAQTGALGATSIENIRKYFQQAAAAIRAGSVEGRGMFSGTRVPLPEDKKQAMAEVQNVYGVSPTSPTGFWEELIEPAIKERWPEQSKPDVEALMKNQKVRKQIRIHLRNDYKVRNVTEKQIDDYIRKNPNIAKELQ